MDLRVPTLIKFLNRLKSGTAAGNKIYIKGNRRNNFRILKKVVYLVYYLKAILKRGTLNIQDKKDITIQDHRRRPRKDHRTVFKEQRLFPPSGS